MAGQYAYWLVDLDGTVVDVEPSYRRQVLSEVGERLGYEFEDRQAEQLWHGYGISPDTYLARWGIDRERFWEAFHEVENATARSQATFVYGDARILADLDQPIGVVTHCQSYLTETVLDRLGISEWFDTVVCCNDEIGWKPDPAPVERAKEALGFVNGEPGMFIGDSSADVGAAWNAGLDGVHIDRHGPNRRECCIRADERVTSFAELSGFGPKSQDSAGTSSTG